MTNKAENRRKYPPNWGEIALAKKKAVSWKCENCGKQCRRPDEPFESHKDTLTVALLDHNPENCTPENLKAWCAPCHLKIDAEEHSRRSKDSRNRNSIERTFENAIIGRDKLIKEELYPRLKEGKPFLIEGQAGIGKTVLLKWCHENCEEQAKAYFSCNWRYHQCIREIAAALGLPNAERMSVQVLEKSILMSGKKATLFIDNVENIKPQMLNFLNTIPGWRMYFAGKNGKIREELKPIIWGMKRVQIRSLNMEDSEEIAKLAIATTGAVIDFRSLVDSGKGVPGRIWAMCRGEVVEDDEKVVGEEIDIFPVLAVFIVGFMICLRYTGKASGSGDLYLIGGIGMGIAIFIRFFATR
ncbi:MAG: ATP-binding protein [Victivallales bacterium]